MAFESEVQVLTQPGGTGNVTYNLARVTDPKAVIIWATPQTADGSIAHYQFSVGFGTYRGSTVAQRCISIKGLDNVANADNSYIHANDCICTIMNTTAGSAGRDLEIDLVSMAGGGTPQVVLGWGNLHTTASIRVFMLVIGGSDVTDALVGDMPTGTASATLDETVVAGFGKPELSFFMSMNDANYIDAAGSPVPSFGFAKQGEAGRMFQFAQTDGNTASLVAAGQRADRCVGFLQNGGGSQIFLGRLDTTVSNWPTDGFRMLLDAASTLNTTISYLAIRTSAQIATGAGAAPTGGSPPVVNTHSVGFTPKMAFALNWSRIASSSVATADATAADLVGIGVGAYDGTQEAWAGWSEDDALGTMDSNSQQSTAKFLRFYNAAASLDAEADAAFSGTDVQVSFNDIHAIAASYQYLVVGDVAAAAQIPMLVQPRSVW